MSTLSTSNQSRTVRLLGVIALIAGLLGSPQAALANASPVGACSDDYIPLTSSPYFTGRKFTGVYNGVKANFDTLNASNEWWGACDPAGMLGDRNVASAWIGLYSLQAQYNLMQIGIISCDHSAIGTVCQNNGDIETPHYFWAAGTCNGSLAANDLGVADFGSHLYEIVLSTSPTGADRFLMKIDGVTKVTLLETDSRISCWFTHSKSAQITNERFDPGDAANGAFSNIQVRSNGSYITPSWTTCSHQQPPAPAYGSGHCHVLSGGGTMVVDRLDT